MSRPPSRSATELLSAIGDGDRSAATALLPLVYEELRRLAQQRMAREPPGQTLQATALVHEAYLRLIGVGDIPWRNRAHFFGAAAEAMRRILVERARRRTRLRHGGQCQRLSLDDSLIVSPAASPDLVALDEALQRLEALDLRKASVVKLRYFAGCSIEQTADALDISPATVKNDWRYAKAWLYRKLSREAH